MKTFAAHTAHTALTALSCSLLLAASLAVAQTTKPAAKPAAKAPQPALLAKPELKEDPRTEACNREVSEKSLRGEARETFLATCLKR